MSDQQRSTPQEDKQRVTIQIPLIRAKIKMNAKLHGLLRTLWPLILLGILMGVATLIVLLVPVDGLINQGLIITILHFGIALATPAMLGLIGEIIGQNSGTHNLGLEGIMAISAFFTFLFAFITQNVIIALIGGSMIGGFVALIHTINVNFLKSNQAISGMAINLAMIGAGGFLYLAIFGSAFTPPQIPLVEEIIIPFFGSLPIWGYALFQQNILTYLAIVLAVAAEYILNHTRLGMQIKAVGQNPEAAATAGINVNRVRVACSVFGGMVAGLGGGFLVVNTGFFDAYLINGRGWIAYALARLALPSPIIGIFASLIFGFGLAIQFRLQALSILTFPYEFVIMLPYLLTMVSLFVYSFQQKRRRGK